MDVNIEQLIRTQSNVDSDYRMTMDEFEKIYKTLELEISKTYKAQKILVAHFDRLTTTDESYFDELIDLSRKFIQNTRKMAKFESATSVQIEKINKIESKMNQIAKTQKILKDKRQYEKIWQKAKLDNSSLIASSAIKESYKVAHSIIVQGIHKNKNLLKAAFRTNEGASLPVYLLVYNDSDSIDKSSFHLFTESEYLKRKKQTMPIFVYETLTLTENQKTILVEKLL